MISFRSVLCCCVAVVTVWTVTTVKATSVTERFSPISLDQITLGGELGRRINLTVEKNVKELDIEGDFIKPFRDKKPAWGGYVGLGKQIDSMVHFALHTGDAEFIALKKHLISEIIASQEPDGYIGMFPENKRVWFPWDYHEAGYIILGLAADYEHFREQKSLDAARRLADYYIKRVSAEPDRIPGEPYIHIPMWIVTTGSDSAFMALGDLLGDGRYIEFCRTIRKVPEWNTRIVTGRFGGNEGHAYAYMSRCLDQIAIHHHTPDPKLLLQSRRVFDFISRGDGMVVTGTCGYSECWHDSQIGSVMLGETCTTVYLLQFLDALIRLDGDSLHGSSIYGDLMERAIFNALFAAQSPVGRQIRYYTPTDGPRTYWPRDTYCCPNNFRRAISELPAKVYYQADGGPVVNLYTTSTAKMILADNLSVTLRQETDYPNSGKVALQVHPSRPAPFPLRMRIPAWTIQATIAVNGQSIEIVPRPGTFATINRIWKAGDRIELQMPMSWRFVRGRKAQSGRVAVMRGPQVFCLSREANPQLAKMRLEPIAIHPDTIEGPFPDDTIRPGGQSCRIKAVPPGGHIGDNPSLSLTLREYPDPSAEATFFLVPNPNAKCIVDDELLGPCILEETIPRKLRRYNR